MASPYFNPYNGKNFFQFFMVLVKRAGQALQGELSLEALVSDELQVLVLLGVSAATALLGSFLILRKMAMLANALSHTILVGIVIAYIMTIGGAAAAHAVDQHDFLNMQVMLWASLATGIITTFLTEFLHKTAGLQEDASVGMVFSSLFALGIVLVTMLTRSAHIGTEIVMGNVDALQLKDCWLVYLVLGIILAALVLFFKELKVTTFDASLSRSLGISPVFFNYFLMTLTSAALISSFRAVGVLMVLSFITGPPLTARLLTDSLKNMLLLAVLFGASASLVGVALSRHFLSVYSLPLSTGAVVVSVIVVQFLAGLLYRKVRYEVRKKGSKSEMLFNPK